MALYTRRVQTTLTKEQYEILLRLARERCIPVSALIREAVEKVYFQPSDQLRRRQALERLLSLNAPAADWEEMEEEIARGAYRRS